MSFKENNCQQLSVTDSFSKRCCDYVKLYKVDLYHDCVTDLSSKIVKLMNINGHIRRMDSIMIESIIRKLSRMELLNTCISKLGTYMNKQQPGSVTRIDGQSSINVERIQNQDFKECLMMQKNTSCLFAAFQNRLLLRTVSVGFEPKKMEP